jgi:hypothetical protein
VDAEKCAGLKCFNPGIAIILGKSGQGNKLRIGLVQLFEQVDTGFMRKEKIGQHHIDIFIADNLQGLLGISRFQYQAIISVAQQDRQFFPVGFVADHQEYASKGVLHFLLSVALFQSAPLIQITPELK